MKNVYLILCFVFSMTIGLFSQNVLSEDFIFDPVDSLENSGSWYRSGINSKYNIKIVSPGLEYANYVGSARGNCSLISNSGEGDIVYRNFSSPITTGEVYMSFLFRVDSLPTTVTQGYGIAFNPNTGGTNLNTALHIKRLSDKTFDFGVRKLSYIDFSNSTYDIHKTYLVVLKYSIVNGVSNDSSSLYVFTNGVPGVEPNKPLAATIEGNDYTGQGSVYLNNNYAQSGLTGCDIKIDGIRVGNSWATSVLAVLTSVSSGESASKFRIENYPNPFQSSTKLKYQIPTKGFVKLHIYNSAGIHCAELINEVKEGGDHEIVWNAKQFPAGVYSCKLQFNGQEINNKLLLIK
ncbi:MAG: T9SS type A sorting domain-containing protein [Saprospiraceae bacterium]